VIRLKGCCGERIILEAKEEEEGNLHKRIEKEEKLMGQISGANLIK